MKLDIKAFGLALGILWAAAYIILAVLSMVNGYGADIITWMSTYYVGSGATPVGIVVGAVWSFADAGVGGVVLAWLYNKLAK